MQTSPPIKAATRPLRSPPKAAKALREPLLARGDQEAGAASGAQPPQPSDDTAYTAHLKAVNVETGQRLESKRKALQWSDEANGGIGIQIEERGLQMEEGFGVGEEPDEL